MNMDLEREIKQLSATFVAMTTHGRTGLKRAIMGSVALYIATRPRPRGSSNSN